MQQDNHDIEKFGYLAVDPAFSDEALQQTLEVYP